MQVAPVHQIEDEAQLVGRVEGVRHADDERAVLTRADQRQHDALVERQRLALLHLDALLIEAFHGVHLARVGLPAAVHLAEAAPADDPVHAEVVHRQLQQKVRDYGSCPKIDIFSCKLTTTFRKHDKHLNTPSARQCTCKGPVKN